MPTGTDEDDGDGWDPGVDAADEAEAGREPSVEDFGVSPEDLRPDAETLSPGEPAADDRPSGDADVPPELARTFWKLVGLSNVATVAIAVGLMFVGFRGRWTLGGQLVAFGLLVVAYMVREYRQFRRQRDDADEEPS